jgi:hypothetical protein
MRMNVQSHPQYRSYELLHPKNAAPAGKTPSRKVRCRMKQIESLPPRQQGFVLTTLDVILKGALQQAERAASRTEASLWPTPATGSRVSGPDSWRRRERREGFALAGCVRRGAAADFPLAAALCFSTSSPTVTARRSQSPQNHASRFVFCGCPTVTQVIKQQPFTGDVSCLNPVPQAPLFWRSPALGVNRSR